MVDALQNLQVVYAKWEQRNSARIGSIRHGSAARPSWRPAFDGNRRPVRNRRNRQDNGVDRHEMMPVDAYNLAWFKTQSLTKPVAVHRRPFSARCCECMPESRICFYNDSLRSAGLHDILQVETKYGQNVWWKRTFCDITYVMERRLCHEYPDVSLAVLTSRRLVEAIRAATRQELEECDGVRQKTEQQLKQINESRAKSMLNKMSARFVNRLIRFTGWFLHKFLSRLLSVILVHKGQMQMLQQACKRGLPVIFLPTHRSHLDYILISFILFHYDIHSPHVAAGDNLLIPFFGFLMRGLGGFFIRRKLDRVAGRKDFVYRAVLHTYMEELLRHGEYMEIFIEGQRTRSGKAVYPKGGLLSVIVDSLMTDVMEDAYIVPVSISYDKIVDGNFIKEQMGEPKVYETFWRALLAVYRVVMGHYGAVRVDFAQAFSLKEFLKVYKSYPDIEGCSSPGDSLLDDDGDKSRARHSHLLPVVSESNMDLVGGDARQLVQCLAEHVVYASIRAQSVLSSHMLALLLLTSHRKGVSVSELAEAFDSLKDDILCRDHDVSFSGETIDVLMHAIEMLGQRLVKLEPNVDPCLLDNEQLSLLNVVPATTLPHVFELSYYANTASVIFATESVLANAVYSLVDRQQWLNMKHGSLISISKNQTMNQSVELCHILKYEYIFSPPCSTLDATLNDAFDRFRNTDMLLTVEQLESLEDGKDADIEEQLMAKRIASRLDCGFEESDDEDSWSSPDETYYLNANEDLLKKFRFLKQVISPVLETYYCAACSLTMLQQQDMLESVYVSSLHSNLKERVLGGTNSFAESVSLDTVRNTIRSFRNLKIINGYEVAGVKMLSLDETYRCDEAALNDFIRHLELYRE